MQKCIVNVYYYLVGENFSWHLHHKKFFINCDPLPIIRHMPNENLTNIDEDFFSLNVINISACLEKINWNLYIRIVANGDVYDLIHFMHNNIIFAFEPFRIWDSVYSWWNNE